MGEKPDAIIDIIDATNIERNLYLTAQLLELERPMVIALNFMDEVEKHGIRSMWHGSPRPLAYRSSLSRPARVRMWGRCSASLMSRCTWELR